VKDLKGGGKREKGKEKETGEKAKWGNGKRAKGSIAECKMKNDRLWGAQEKTSETWTIVEVKISPAVVSE